jgi:riboflavin kinase/FMN adenylyltransferase
VPTANVQPINEHKLMPGNGIYAVTAVVDGVEFFGAANVGTRPTFTNDVVPTLEVHLFETDADLYGKTMTVEFQRFLRTEQKFDSKESLIEQMRSDIHEAQTFFQTHVFRTSS